MGGIISEFSKASISKSEVEETKSIDARIPKPKWLSRKVVADISLLYDMAAIIFSAWASYYLYIINYLDDEGVDSKGYFLIVMIVTALFYVIARQRGQYDQHMDFRFTSQMSTLIYVCAITIASAFGVVFFLKIQTEFLASLGSFVDGTPLSVSIGWPRFPQPICRGATTQWYSEAIGCFGRLWQSV
jgi:uncharacterized membrane protein YiaA